MAVVSPFAAAEMTGNSNRFSDFLTIFIICFSLQILFDFRKRGFPVPENRRAHNIQQFSNCNMPFAISASAKPHDTRAFARLFVHAGGCFPRPFAGAIGTLFENAKLIFPLWA